MKNERNTFIQNIQEDPNDFLESEVGDIKSEQFFPQVKIKRFGNEYNLSLRYKHNEQGNEFLSEDNGRITWKKGNKEARFYEIEGGHEFEVILNEKPLTNVIDFTIRTKGIRFLYQGEIRDERVHQPENAIGSYAIYAENVRKTYEKGKIYGIGKIGHIFRPKIIDSNGEEVWGELNLDDNKGILSIVIPQEFLDSATYPVTVDPTIGYGTAGALSIDMSSIDVGYCNLIGSLVAATGDVITGYSFYARKLASNRDILLNTYRIQGGVPTTKIVASDKSVTVNSTTPQWWNSSAVSESLNAGNEYNVAFANWAGTFGSSETTRVYVDSLSGGSSHGNANSLPSTWTETSTFNYIFSLYATFTRAPVDIAYSYNIYIDRANP